MEDAVKGDKPSNGLVENAVMLFPLLPWLVEHAESILSRCQKGRDGRTPFERLHGKKPASRKGSDETNIIRTIE